jgi:hypothetical protein
MVKSRASAPQRAFALELPTPVGAVLDLDPRPLARQVGLVQALRDEALELVLADPLHSAGPSSNASGTRQQGPPSPSASSRRLRSEYDRAMTLSPSMLRRSKATKVSGIEERRRSTASQTSGKSGLPSRRRRRARRRAPPAPAAA